MLTGWLDVAPIAKQDSASVPLWAYLVSVGAVLIVGLVGSASAWFTTRANIKHQNRAFERQVEEEHRQWLRQKRVETYEIVLKHFLHHQDWRRDHFSILSSLRFRHFIDLHRLFNDTSEMYKMCLMYAPAHICLLVEQMTTPTVELMQSDQKRLITGRGLPSELPEKYTLAYNRLQVAIREDIQSLRSEDHSKPAKDTDK